MDAYPSSARNSQNTALRLAAIHISALPCVRLPITEKVVAPRSPETEPSAHVCCAGAGPDLKVPSPITSPVTLPLLPEVCARLPACR